MPESRQEGWWSGMWIDKYGRPTGNIFSAEHYYGTNTKKAKECIKLLLSVLMWWSAADGWCAKKPQNKS